MSVAKSVSGLRMMIVLIGVLLRDDDEEATGNELISWFVYDVAAFG